MSNFIRPTALCIFRRGDAILVYEAFDTVKGSAYCRPVGGGIEWGERAAETVVREIREELNQEIENVRLLGVLENIFECEGSPGHEIIFVFDADLCDSSLLERASLPVREGDELFEARWRTPASIVADGARLVPENLMSLL